MRYLCVNSPSQQVHSTCVHCTRLATSKSKHERELAAWRANGGDAFPGNKEREARQEAKQRAKSEREAKQEANWR